jgi:predicted AlkP superfamily pyrophosphatase or phosphodiesterase
VLLLVDGLGTALLERLPAWSFLRTHYRRDLRSVFPSSTAACLTSLVTGMWPGQHGVLGWWTYLPASGVTAKPVHFRDASSGRALDRETFAPLLYGATSLFAHDGWRPELYFPDAFVMSPYTAFLAGAAPVHGYENLRDLAVAVPRRARRSCSSFSFIYFPGLDKATHKFGVAAPETLTALHHLDCAVAAIAAAMGRSTTMIVTGDHGQVDAGTASDLVLDRRDPLLGYLVDRPSGERRLPFFHVRPEHHDDFEQDFNRRFEDGWELLDADSAVRGGLLGPCRPNATVRDRLGDYVAIGRDASSFRLSLDRPLKATHGGMTDREVLVPLIVYSS